ncbi:amidase domain-containing protein [Caloranaerobacter ferrireducens]|uniref:amidase domain-containing protein n=1 Tax=Caloranaerobacter ferrireducens TaxID=1323370 RepID=UPI00084E008C|nr:amidase domain-containing protein [Caloranaerobacter ferrireducens]
MKKFLVYILVLGLFLGTSLNVYSSDNFEYRIREDKSIKGFQIRYLKEFKKSQSDMRDFALKKYEPALKYIEKYFNENDIDIPVDIDNEDFQKMIYLFAFPNKISNVPTENLISFVKFMDIYENYEQNRKIENITRKFKIASKEVEAINGVSKDDILLLNSLMPSIATPTKNNEEESLTLNNIVTVESSNGYNPNAARDYAYTWAYKTNNSEYGYYANYYGVENPSDDMTEEERPWNDCTNFVSQCLEAGGMNYIKETIWTPYNDEENWYYSDNKPSYTWGGAHNFYLHWRVRAGIAPFSSDLTVGDVVNADFGGDGHIDHTAIITKDTGSASSNLYLTQHTTDRKEKYDDGRNYTLKAWYDNGYTVYGYEMDKASN